MTDRPSTQSRRSPANVSWLPELLQLHGPLVLVVERSRALEPLMRRAAGSLVPRVSIDWCTSADTAHELLQRHLYDAVIADWRLDGAFDGLSLRFDCWRHQPQATFALTSSYPLARFLSSAGAQTIPFLAKPFDLWRCREFLSSLVGERAQIAS